MRNVFEYIDDEHLEHHGIKGQKWGIRRFQNPDGSLTEAGRQRYSKSISKYQNSDGSLTEAGKKRYLGPDGLFGLYSIKGVRDFKNKKFDHEIAKKYYEHLDENAKKDLDAIKKIDKPSERAKAEENYLKSMLKEPGLITDAEIARYHVLSKEYNAKSGDWYNGRSVSKKHERALLNLKAKQTEERNCYSNLKNLLIKKYGPNRFYDHFNEIWSAPEMKKMINEVENARKELDMVVLNDLGFEITDKNMEYIRYLWQID